MCVREIYIINDIIYIYIYYIRVFVHIYLTNCSLPTLSPHPLQAMETARTARTARTAGPARTAGNALRNRQHGDEVAN